MEARCLPVCSRLIINSLTRNFFPTLPAAAACYERICGPSILQTTGSVSKVRLTNWIPPVSFCLDEEEGVRVARVRRGGEKWALPVGSTSYMTLQPFNSTAHTNPESGIPGKKWEKGIPTKKREKSIQINNLKWHSKWHSASPFPATVSCSQTGLLYVSMSELVPGETLWSRCLFFSMRRGNGGYVHSTVLRQEEAEVWWLECAGCDLQLVMITWWMLWEVTRVSEKNWGGGRWWSGRMHSVAHYTVKRKPFTEIPTLIHTLKAQCLFLLIKNGCPVLLLKVPSYTHF